MITVPQKIGPVSGGAVRVNQVRQHAAAAVSQTGHSAESFDQVTLTTREGAEPQKLELRSKLSQEVRTATTTGTLAALRQQVQAGEYKIDAGSIAKKLLLLGEV